MSALGLLLIILIIAWLASYLPPPVPAPGQPYSLIVFILLVVLFILLVVLFILLVVLIIYLLRPVLWTF